MTDNSQDFDWPLAGLDAVPGLVKPPRTVGLVPPEKMGYGSVDAQPMPEVPFAPKAGLIPPENRTQQPRLRPAPDDLGHAAPSTLREFGFAVLHPNAAVTIGSDQRLGTNMSSVARRFGASIGLQENRSKEGTEANAFRHTLWQAMLAASYGSDLAERVGEAHEVHPHALAVLGNDPSSL